MVTTNVPPPQAYGITNGVLSSSASLFGVEYFGSRHSQQLRGALKEHYNITKNWKGDLYAGINLKWDYTKRTCRLTMDNYIAALFYWA